MIIRYFQFSGTEQVGGYTVANLTSVEGLDWYASQSLFDAGKLKIEFGDDGVITRYSDDVSMLWPVDKSVADISNDAVPEGMNDKGEWLFDGEKIIPRPVDYTAQAEAQKQMLMSDATIAIAPLQDAVDLGEATEEEQTLLSTWKKYRVMINRVDTSLAPACEWPEKPAR